MDERRQDLNNIRDYIQNTNKELTLLLQNLQWDLKQIIEKPTLSSCSINPNHRIPESSRKVHEQHCFLTHHGYTTDKEFLPDPPDVTNNIVVKLSTQDIQNVINVAAYSDPLFKRGKGNQGPEPLTVERLQATYTADERRVIHDAVVNAAPFAHDLTDLALGSNSQEGGKKSRSRAEVMAELRDMRRRRAKYRVPSKTTNYSHVLKDVIKSQMDLYAETNGIFIKTEYGSKSFVSLNDDQSLSNQNNTAPEVVIKQERMSPELETIRNKRHTQENNRSSNNQYEDRISSRNKERHSHTRDAQGRNARSNGSRHKYREENKYERRSRDYKNDAGDKYDLHKEKRNEQRYDKFQRSPTHESFKHDKNDTSRSSRESRDRARYDRNKGYNSSRSGRDGRYDDNYQKIRIKEEKDDYYEGRKKRKYN